MKKSHSLQSQMNLRPQSTSLKKSRTNIQEVTKIQTKNVKVRKKRKNKQTRDKERESERKRK